MKNKGYLEFPLGQDAAAYLAVKRKRLTAKTELDYESTLDKLARHFPTNVIGDFEPPDGTDMLEALMLGHASMTTTGNAYLGWEDDRLDETLLQAIRDTASDQVVSS